MFWHNKREETPDWNRQGCAPPRLDGELSLKADDQNLGGGGLGEIEELYLGVSLIIFLNGLT